MTVDDWIEFLEERIAKRKEICAALERDVEDGDPTATFVGETSRGMGVRPRILEHHADGRKTYMLNYRQAQKALRIAKGRRRCR